MHPVNPAFTMSMIEAERGPRGEARVKLVRLQALCFRRFGLLPAQMPGRGSQSLRVRVLIAFGRWMACHPKLAKRA